MVNEVWMPLILLIIVAPLNSWTVKKIKLFLTENCMSFSCRQKNRARKTAFCKKSFIGLAAFYAWARAKHFGCHSVCLSFCHHREVTFRSSNLNIACSTATSLSPLIGKVTFYCTFVSREPRKV